MRIALIGEIHGNPLPLIQAIPHADAVIQLGDFAVLPSGAVVSTVPIYWIDGNHEWFHLFAQYQDAESPVAWAPNCFFVPRGAVLELGSTRFLCMGGADSVDKVRQGAAGRRMNRSQESRSAEPSMQQDRSTRSCRTRHRNPRSKNTSRPPSSNGRSSCRVGGRHRPRAQWKSSGSITVGHRCTAGICTNALSMSVASASSASEDSEVADA